MELFAKYVKFFAILDHIADNFRDIDSTAQDCWDFSV